MKGVLVDLIYNYSLIGVMCFGTAFFVVNAIVPKMEKITMPLAFCFLVCSGSFFGVSYWEEDKLNNSKILLKPSDLLSISAEAEQSLFVSSSSPKSYVISYMLSLPEMINEIDLTAKPSYQFVGLECDDPKDCYQASFSAKPVEHLGEKLTMNLSCDDTLISCLDAIEDNSDSISALMRSAVAQEMKIISVKIK